ncbi:MAG: hypothetical protein AAF249_07325 [Pseudomonadota bacterium]
MSFLKRAALRVISKPEPSKVDEVMSEIENIKAKQQAAVDAQNRHRTELTDVLTTLTELTALQRQANERQASQERQERKGIVKGAAIAAVAIIVLWLMIPTSVGLIADIALDKQASGSRPLKDQVVCDFSGGYVGDCRDEGLLAVANAVEEVREQSLRDTQHSQPPAAPRRPTVIQDQAAQNAVTVTAIVKAIEAIRADPFAQNEVPMLRSVELARNKVKIEFQEPNSELAQTSSTDSDGPSETSPQAAPSRPIPVPNDLLPHPQATPGLDQPGASFREDSDGPLSNDEVDRIEATSRRVAQASG